jgi:hypothetical protein
MLAEQREQREQKNKQSLPVDRKGQELVRKEFLFQAI